MLFITNRELKESIRFKENRRVNFDLDKNAPANSVFFCTREKRDHYQEIGHQAFMQQLKVCKAQQLLIYIHGFSNLPEPDIFPRARKLQQLFDKKKKDLIEVVPIIWPCDNDLGVVKDYWDDQKSADYSAASLARVLEKFRQWQSATPTDTPLLKKDERFGAFNGEPGPPRNSECLAKVSPPARASPFIPQHLSGGR